MGPRKRKRDGSSGPATTQNKRSDRKREKNLKEENLEQEFVENAPDDAYEASLSPQSVAKQDNSPEGAPPSLLFLPKTSPINPSLLRQYQSRQVSLRNEIINRILGPSLEYCRISQPPVPTEEIDSTKLDDIANAMWNLALNGNMLNNISQFAIMKFPDRKLRILAMMSVLPAWWFCRDVARAWFMQKGYEVNDDDMGIWLNREGKNVDDTIQSVQLVRAASTARPTTINGINSFPTQAHGDIVPNGPPPNANVPPHIHQSFQMYNTPSPTRSGYTIHGLP